MKKLKVKFANEIDISIFDKDFYLSLLKNISKLKQEKEQNAR